MITEIISLSKRNTQTFPYRSVGQNERILKKNGRKTEPIKAEVIFYLENQEVNLQYTFKIKCLTPALGASLVAQTVKNLLAMQETGFNT